MRFGTKLPHGVTQSEKPPKVEDEDSYQRLNNLVREAAKQLEALSQNPVAVAASPNRFDDARNYEWCAVRCGNFFSEKESYMGKYDLDRDLLAAPAEPRSAYGVLVELEKRAWRDLYANAFDIEWADQSLSIVVQDGLTWLVFSSNNSTIDGDPVFAIWEDEPISYFGEAEERFDWAIQQPRPLIFRSTSGS